MTHINIIIKYLSNEMSEDEKSEFLRKKEEDIALQKEYLSALEIWEIAKKEMEIKEKAAVCKENRDDLIAEVLAEHDINLYKQKTPSQGEESFKDELRRVIAENRLKKISYSRKSGKNIITILVSLAASVSLLFIVIQGNKDPYKMALNYYAPQNDMYIKDHAVITRSDDNKAIAYFHNREFYKARELFIKDSSTWNMNPWIQIYYALACYEIGKKKDAENTLKNLSKHVDPNISSTSNWYLSLLLIKQEKYISAKPYLETLAGKETRYRRKAIRLLRKINKELT